MNLSFSRSLVCQINCSSEADVIIMNLVEQDSHPTNSEPNKTVPEIESMDVDALETATPLHELAMRVGSTPEVIDVDMLDDNVLTVRPEPKMVEEKEIIEIPAQLPTYPKNLSSTLP